MESYRHMNCILRVDTQSSGWEKSLTKVIKRVKDVSYSIDTAHGVVRIAGEINPHKLLTDIKKAGKHAELIHVDCGGGHSHSNYGYGYEYDGGYGNLEPHRHTYPYYESKPVRGYFQSQSYPHQSNGFFAPASVQRHAPPLPPPSAPPLGYDPYNPSCNIM